MVWFSKQCYWQIIKRTVADKRMMIFVNILQLSPLNAGFACVPLSHFWFWCQRGGHIMKYGRIWLPKKRTQKGNKPSFQRNTNKLLISLKYLKKTAAAVFGSKPVSFILAVPLMVIKLEGFRVPSDENHFGTGPVLTWLWFKLSHSKQIMDFACFIS